MKAASRQLQHWGLHELGELLIVDYSVARNIHRLEQSSDFPVACSGFAQQFRDVHNSKQIVGHDRAAMFKKTSKSKSSPRFLVYIAMSLVVRVAHHQNQSSPKRDCWDLSCALDGKCSHRHIYVIGLQGTLDGHGAFD